MGAVVLIALLLLASLDRPSVKRPLQRFLEAHEGVRVDWGATAFRPFSGLHIEDLRVAAPAPFAQAGPLARVAEVEIGWSGGLFGGRLDRVRLSGVHLTVVDDGTRDSLGALLAAMPASPPGPAKPLSEELGGLFSGGLPVGRVSVDDLTVTLIDRGVRFELDGLSLAGGGASHRLSASLGSQEAPLRLRLTDGTHQLAARLWIQASAEDRQAGVSGQLELASQSFDPKLPPVAHVLGFRASAEVDRRAGRTRVTLDRIDAVDGALSGALALALPDVGSPRLDRIDLKVDLARLLAAVPAALAPPRLRSGALEIAGRGLALGGLGQLDPNGRLTVSGQLDGLRLAQDGAELAVDGGRLRLEAQAEEGGRVSGRLTVEVARAAERKGSASSELDRARIALVLKSLSIDPSALLATTGTVDASGRVGGLTAAKGGLTLVARELGLTASTRLDGKPPYALRAELPVGGLAIRRARGRPLLPDTPGRLAIELGGVRPDPAAPVRSTGRLHATVDLGGLTLDATCDKRAESASYDLRAGGRLALARFLAPTVGGLEVPWEKMAVDFRSQGTVRNLGGAPELSHHTTIALAHPAFIGDGTDLRAAELSLALDSSGSARAHHGRFALDLSRLRVERRAIGDGHLAGRLAFDLGGSPTIDLALDGQGAAGPDGTLSIAARFDRRARSIRYRADGALARLAAAEPFLPAGLRRAVDWTRLRIGLHATGEIAGVVTAVRGGRPILVHDPLARMRGTDQIDVTLDDLRYHDGDLAAEAPHVQLHTRIDRQAAQSTFDAGMEAPRLRATSGEDDLTIDGLRQSLHATLDGDPRDGVGQAAITLALASARDAAHPTYPIGDLALSAALARSAAGDVRLGALTLDNKKGGTHLEASGTLDLTASEGVASGGLAHLIAGRRSLALSAKLAQRLEPLSGGISGRGQLGLEARVESADLRLYHLVGTVTLAGSHLDLVDPKVTIDGADARVPITQDLAIDPAGGWSRLGGVDVNAYPRLRFSDQHPFLSTESYLSVRRISGPQFSIGPLAGNARIDRNLFALDQLEAEVAGGKLSGQCLLDLAGDDTKVYLRGDATGLEPAGAGAGERLDANAAITLSVKSRDLEGRADLVRIGPRHLADLLDLYDPYHADVAANRVRLALKIGYPKRVSLRFEQGFASLQVALGGLARVVRIDEIRGIPVGPIVEKYLGPLFPTEKAP